MNQLTSQQFHTHARLHGERLAADYRAPRARRRRATRRPSRVRVISVGAVAILGGVLATHGAGVDAQSSPTPPTTTQPVDAPSCEVVAASMGPAPSTDRAPHRRPGAGYDHLMWKAV